MGEKMITEEKGNIKTERRKWYRKGKGGWRHDKIIRYRVKKSSKKNKISKSKAWGNREKQRRKRLKKKDKRTKRIAERGRQKEKWWRGNGNAMFAFIIATFRVIIPRAKRYRAQSIADRYLDRAGPVIAPSLLSRSINGSACNATWHVVHRVSLSLSFFSLVIDLEFTSRASQSGNYARALN